jgi:hypothetical protein
MSIKIRLTNGDFCEASAEVLSLSDLFVEEDNILKVNTNNVKTVEKISDFAKYYSQLTKPQKNIINDPKKLSSAEEPMKKWFESFSVMDPQVLIELLTLSYDMNIKPLLELCSYITAGIINNKTPEEIGKFFGITCDYDDDELDKLRRNLAWTNL